MNKINIDNPELSCCSMGCLACVGREFLIRFSSEFVRKERDSLVRLAAKFFNKVLYILDLALCCSANWLDWRICMTVADRGCKLNKNHYLLSLFIQAMITVIWEEQKGLLHLSEDNGYVQVQTVVIIIWNIWYTLALVT